MKYLDAHQFIYCKALKRKVYLSKLPQAILIRRSSVTQRLQRFFVSIDILKHEKYYTIRTSNGYEEYEIKGMDAHEREI